MFNCCPLKFDLNKCYFRKKTRLMGTVSNLFNNGNEIGRGSLKKTRMASVEKVMENYV